VARGAALAVEDLQALSELTRPLTLAKERMLPVRADLAALLPFGGLRRGTVVQAESPMLALALIATATTEGSWAAFVGTPSLGLASAAGQGVALERVVAVTIPPPELAATVVAALIDALDVVVVGPNVITRAADARRLAARGRERGGVLLSLGAWPEATDLRVRVERHRWEGLDRGHGHLRGWAVALAVEGRGAASRPRRGTIELGCAPAGRAGDVRASPGASTPVPTPCPPVQVIHLEQAG
jgi:hypothetical protein